MSLKKKEVIGEGGVHRHVITTPEKTDTDGLHKHLFLVFDRLLMTDLSGEHDHNIDVANNLTEKENKPHEHVLNIQTQSGLQQFPTKNVTPHSHELQTKGTTLSGLHAHEAEINDETFISLLPGDLLEEIEAAAKKVPALKDFKVRKSNDPMEMDFQLVKRLNQSDFRDILKTAGIKAVFKGLSRLKEGFQIESLILSRERFADIGLARRFVMDHGFEPKSSLEGNNEASDFVFQIAEQDKFDSSTLGRIHVTDGVIAVIGLLSDTEKEDELEAETVSEGNASDALTENATEVDPPTLAERFANLKRLHSDGKKKKKKKLKKKQDRQKFLFLKTGKELKGSVADQLQEIADNHEIETKYVTVEYPEKRFVEVLTENYEVISASYEGLAEGILDEDDEGGQDYKSLHVKGENIEAFIVASEGLGGYKKSLVIFFDDPKHLDAIFKTEITNYKFGAYQFKQTMMGPILLSVENDNSVEPILDEELLDNLDNDTMTFFSKEIEDFFAGKNPAKKKLPYKRGVLMHGPPGNGKTTFIKYFAQNHVKNGYAVLCEAQDFSGCMGKFLKQHFGKDAKKVIVFEDVDAIAYDYCKRSEFLNFLDGVNTIYKTLFIATTNYPHHLDEALLKRPSRFDQKYYIGLPDVKMRSKFLKSFFPDVSNVDITMAIQETEGFSGAMFKEVFILTGLQRISLAKAIVRMRDQMELNKAAPISFKSVADIIWKNLPQSKLKKMAKKEEIIIASTNISKQIPDKDATPEEKRKAQKARAKEFNIEALEDGTESLIPPAGTSGKMSDFGDPVNFKFPIDSDGRTRNAIARFGQGIGGYEKESSINNVAERIGQRAFNSDIDISEDAEIWEHLSGSLKDKFTNKTNGASPMDNLKDKFEKLGGKRGKKRIHNKPRSGKKIKKNLGFFEILKTDEDQRLVTGPILLPEKFDLQNDIISGGEITKGIHNYMVKLAFQADLDFLESLGLSEKSERGFMHQEFSRKIAFVEMFIVNDDRGFMMMNKRKLMNGTAIGVAKVFDDEVWTLVKTKKINGFSIGGRSKVVAA